MINEYYISASKDTPLMDFNAETGQFKISGTSISNLSNKLFADLNLWLEEYIINPKSVTQLIINLDYFNISTSKYLLDILYKLKEIQKGQKMVTIEWHYNSDEEDMLELGEDYEMMVRLPFKYVGHKHAANSVC